MADLLHELRAPLGGIEAMAELLAGSAVNPEQARIIASLQASAAHLRAIADHGLGAAREPAGPMRLEDLISAIAVSGEARARLRGLGFVLCRSDLPADLHVPDATALRQVLENLIDNAIRLTVTGEITLSVARQGDRLAVSLADRGPGLTEVQAEALMTRGGTLADRAGGAGLGLRIARRVVAAHGGNLSVRPQAEGTGSIFGFDWPLALHAPVQPEVTAAPSCLVLDDHPASRLVLRTILSRFGRDASEAATIAEAEAVLAQGPLDLVLVDLRLQGGDSLAFIRGCRALRQATPMQLVVVSADDPIEAGLAADDFDAAILKPISVQAVADALRRIDSQQARRQQVSAA
jgi:CheY-like chemotaxis protein